MGLIGIVLILSSLVGGEGLSYLHPANVFIWIGMGLWLGGGGLCMVAWESARPKPENPPEKPVKHLEKNRELLVTTVLTSILTIGIPILAAIVSISMGGFIRSRIAESEQTPSVLANILFAPFTPGIMFVLAVLSIGVTIAILATCSRKICVSWNIFAAVVWSIFLVGYYVVASLIIVAQQT